MHLGFVGAGRMGRPMVRRLVAAGHAVRVLARPTARESLVAEGFDVTAQTADLSDVDAVLVCVLTDQQVREVCLDSALPAGATVVVHTTASPSTVEAIAGRGLDVIDAPVSGGPHDVTAGRVTLFVGGADASVERLRPVLAAFAEPILHIGRLGSGQRVKLLNNALFAAQIGLLAQAARLATEWGVDEAVLLDALKYGSAASRALTGAALRGSVAAFAGSAGPFLDKDLRTFHTVAAELGGDLGVLAPALALLAELT
jgi:3-hydroxyisobutyrate dehydrogenase-like beta-hydroxyacid dehydrogenase